jgi:DNA-binding NarL/FixJ family response regulator
MCSPHPSRNFQLSYHPNPDTPQLLQLLFKMNDFGKELTANRGRNCELSSEVRAAICAAKLAGKSTAQIARDFNVHRNTVNKTIQRFQNHATLKSLPRKGRPEKVTPT